MIRRNEKRNRRGAIVVLSALFLIVLLGIVAFGLDLGYLANARTELQRAADAAAIAATSELVDDATAGQTPDLTDEISQARQAAVQYAGLNKICGASASVNQNAANSTSGDVVVGYLSNPSSSSTVMTFGNPNQYNSVQVTVRRAAGENGEVPLFFGRIFGNQSQAIEAKATAAILTNFGGFRTPTDGSELDLLPFALDEQTWNGLLNGTGTDTWKWDATNSRVSAGSDGVKEVNLYPQGTGSPGNRGTVDIGSSNNSTADIARQIVHGVSAEDLAYLGGSIQLNSSGTLILNGDTGISAGVKDELASIIGKPRIIPIFRSVSGPGNNAQYTIVKFAGVRIMEVVLTGKMSSKRVTIQPANIVTGGGIPATGDQASYGIYSRVWLVR